MILNHLSQPNKQLNLKLDFIIYRELSDGVIEIPWEYDYSTEMEPVVSSDGSESWRSVKPITEQDFTDEQYFEKWVYAEGYKHPKLTDWSAIDIFKENIYSICMDKIASYEDVPGFTELLSKVRNENKLDVQRAKAFPMEEVFRMFGFEIRLGSINCPFHDDSTPSLGINKKTNRWRCFGCGASGDTIDFIMKFTNCPFREAVRRLN